MIFEFQDGPWRRWPTGAFERFSAANSKAMATKSTPMLGEGIVYVSCGAHIRRAGFVDAAKVSLLDPVAPEILARFGELYAVEKEAREGRLSPEASPGAAPDKECVPIMRPELKTRLVEIRQKIQPGKKLAQACDYARWDSGAGGKSI